ncbi:MAG: arginine N-succinyltransferase [Rubrivivax sp.]|nr:arginine N-succinyltransferase [Rubrivivax sp.]
MPATRPSPALPFSPERFVLRAATMADLDALERLAHASAVGITTLPPDRAALAARLQRSCESFASSDEPSGEEIYLFVLEDAAAGQAVIGTCGIAASAGFADRFYCFRNETIVHASPALRASNRIHTLHLCHSLTGHTLLTSFYIEPAYEASVAPQLLSRARLLFIAEFAERFSPHIASESPGLADDEGRCPFWDAVGRRFFEMDYPAAERLAVGRSKAFIAELMPQGPIYVPLLPEEAQWAIGQLNPVAELPFAILQDEGFDSETYVDIFDGGPIVEARLAMLRTVQQSRAAPAAWQPPGARHGQPPWHLVALARREGFRAVLARAHWTQGHWRLDSEAAGRLGLASAGAEAGTRLRAAPLAQGSGPAGAEGGAA